MGGSFLASAKDFLANTHLVEQVSEVQVVELFTNPWFMVPFVALILYMAYKKAWRDIIIIAIFIGVWVLSGTEYMKTLVIGEDLQAHKVLPVVFGGAAALGVVVYLIFGRSE
jgi:hypothetical protein